MICEPQITVVCDGDGCGEEDYFSLTSLAGGGWDGRNLSACLKRAGWAEVGEKHFCPGCVEDGEAEAAQERANV